MDQSNKSKDSKTDEISRLLIKASYLQANGLYDDDGKVFEKIPGKYPEDGTLKEVFKMFKRWLGYEQIDLK